jgi:hypothetical protein
MPVRLVLAMGVLVGFVVLLAGCGSSAPADFTLQQQPPQVSGIDLSDGDGNRGDLLTFEGALAKDGAPFGVLLGQLITAGVDGGPGRLGGFEERIAHLVFRLPDGTITATGASLYPRAQWRLPAEREHVRVITGGSGAYLGAGGEVRTIREAGGSYRHAFVFAD